jgi:hypothetical protein
MSRYNLKPETVPVARKKGLFRRGKTQDVVVAESAPTRVSVAELKKQLAEAEKEETKQAISQETFTDDSPIHYSIEICGDREWVEEMLKKAAQ